MVTRSGVLGALCGLALVGCMPKNTEFADSAERLLEEKLSGDPGGAWTVRCTDPADVEIDTTFTCSATNGELEQTFTGSITGRSKFVVTADNAAPRVVDPTAATTVVSAATTSSS